MRSPHKDVSTSSAVCRPSAANHQLRLAHRYRSSSYITTHIYLIQSLGTKGMTDKMASQDFQDGSTTGVQNRDEEDSASRMAAATRTVLVGGGSGFVGTHLCRALTKVGYDVAVISRDPSKGKLTWTDIRRNGLPRCVAVVNTAGQNVFDKSKRWTDAFKDEVISSRVQTTATLAQAIAKAEEKPKVFVSMSGVGYYKPDPEAEYTEDSPGGDFDFLSRLAADWEKAAQLPPECKDTRVVIIRSGVVIGRQGGVIKDMYWPFYFGVGGPVASGEQFFPWIHVNDLVGLIMFAIEKDKVRGVLNGVAPHVIRNKEFAQALGGAMWRPALFPLPAFVLNLIFSEERAKIMTEGQRVLPKRTMELGFTYDYPTIQRACAEVAHTVYKD